MGSAEMLVSGVVSVIERSYGIRGDNLILLRLAVLRDQ